MCPARFTKQLSQVCNEIMGLLVYLVIGVIFVSLTVNLKSQQCNSLFYKSLKFDLFN